MITINLKTLIEKFSPGLKEGLEGAAGIAMSRGNYAVEVEHWLLKLLDQNSNDLCELLSRYEIGRESVAQGLARSMERMKSGNTRPPSLSPSIVDTAKSAWMLASVEHGQSAVTSGHVLAALLLDESTRRDYVSVCPDLEKIAPESIRETSRAVVGETDESREIARAGTTTPAGSGAPASGGSALQRFTTNLTEQARNGKIDPVLGRDREIRQVIDILMRRRQNNPILTGEAGVGKTAVVEGFALRIAEGDVPPPLRHVELLALDLTLLQAGASVKGEFENRLKAVISESQSSEKPTILFIDEAHTMIGAGGSEGQGDAANLLKPALARGELRTIGATTFAEYKKYFEKDPALTRRFQVVQVDEPEVETAINMMRGIARSLEKHHGIVILDEAIVESVTLSSRYVPGRQLPDKSVSLLDTACARVALSQSATPAALEDARRIVDQSERNIELFSREQLQHGGMEAQIAAAEEAAAEAKARVEALEAQWQQERAIVDQMMALRAPAEATEPEDGVDHAEAAGDSDDIRAKMRQLDERLHEIQGDAPLIKPYADGQAVAEVVANWTGIPVGKMVSDEIEAIQNLQARLEERVVGQSHALKQIAERVQMSRAGLVDPRRPTAVFLMCGPSGTGKTETALALADSLFGGEQNVTTINMSEFKEEHKVSMLLGAPAGYVGYGEGGVLTEAVRRKPYSVVLLDEMEKAHPGIQDVFYNVFDKGTVKDGEGRDIDFRNTIIIMTSNAASHAIHQIVEKTEGNIDHEDLLANIRPELAKHFRPAFLGRTTVIPYFPLSDEVLFMIAKLSMRRVERRLEARYGASLNYSEDVLIQLLARVEDAETGARNLENIINQTMLPRLANLCLAKIGEGAEIEQVNISTNEETGEFVYELVSPQAA